MRVKIYSYRYIRITLVNNIFDTFYDIPDCWLLHYTYMYVFIYICMYVRRK